MENEHRITRRTSLCGRLSAWGLALALSAGLLAGDHAPFATRSAEAQPSKIDEAKQRFQKGVDLFGESDFQASLIEFKRSYELVPNFNVLYNIGQVYFQLQDYANALRTLQQYLELGGNRITASRRDSVEKDIEKLKGRVATVNIKVSVPGAEVYVDDSSVGKSPLKDGVLVSAGKRRFSATKDGFNTARDSKEIASGETADVTLTLTELTAGQKAAPPTESGAGGAGSTTGSEPSPGGGTEPGAGAPPSPSHHGSMVGPIVGFSLTGAFAIGWGVTGGLALGASSDLKKLKTTLTTKSALDAAANKAKHLGIASDVMMGFTIAGAGVSTVLTILAVTSSDKGETKHDDKATQPTVDFAVGPTGGVVYGTF